MEGMACGIRRSSPIPLAECLAARHRAQPARLNRVRPEIQRRNAASMFASLEAPSVVVSRGWHERGGEQLGM